MERSTSRHGHPQASARFLYQLALFWFLDLVYGNGWTQYIPWNPTRNLVLVLEILLVAIPFLAYSRKLGNRRISDGLRSFKPSRGTNLLVLIILAGDIEMNPSPKQCKKNIVRRQTRLSRVGIRECFSATCANLSEKELLELGSENGSWYCKDCKAE